PLDPGPPEVLAGHDLVEVLDAPRVFPDDEPADILDRADDAVGLPLQRGLAPAVQTVLVGFDLDENPVPHVRIDDGAGNPRDLHACRYPFVHKVKPGQSPQRRSTLASS